MSSTGTVFTTNRTQAVRLPAEARFPPGVKRVHVRAVGNERVLAPADAVWDSFFDAASPRATDDFLGQRADQHEAERDSL